MCQEVFQGYWPFRCELDTLGDDTVGVFQLNFLGRTTLYPKQAHPNVPSPNFNPTSYASSVVEPTKSL